MFTYLASSSYFYACRRKQCGIDIHCVSLLGDRLSTDRWVNMEGCHDAPKNINDGPMYTIRRCSTYHNILPLHRWWLASFVLIAIDTASACTTRQRSASAVNCCTISDHVLTAFGIQFECFFRSTTYQSDSYEFFRYLYKVLILLRYVKGFVSNTFLKNRKRIL